jgi:hypothetical protein
VLFRSGCPELTSFHIVGSVSNIAATFIECSGVCEITVDDDQGRFRTIDHFLVEQNRRSLVCSFGSEEELVVPSEVVSLKAKCFWGGGSQLEVIEKAFSSCDSLRSIRLPASLVLIGEEAFNNLSSLVDVSFESPSNLTRIWHRGFFRCNGLTSLTFPSSLTLMAKESVSFCGRLRSVIFESGSLPPQMDPDAFAHCPSLDLSLLKRTGRTWA